MMLNNLMFVFFWSVVYNKTQNIGDYSFRDVMIVWSIASAAFGFKSILFGNIGNIALTIVEGGLDVYLLQPKNIYISLICSRMRVAGWGDLLYGYGLFAVVTNFNLIDLALFTCFVILGAILMAAVFTSIESLSFFFGNTYSLYRLVLFFLLTVCTYPESIFGKWMRFLIYTALPAGFIVFMPLNILKTMNISSLLILMAVDAIYVAVGYMIFMAGLKRYESGNLLNARV
jgi:ABC-2 type transport system permease protein